MQDDNSMLPQKIFVVILDDVLVARDIEMIIRNLRPDARVVVARTLDDAMICIADGQIETAFVQCDAARLMASPLGLRVLRDGGHIVLAGQEQTAEHKGVSALPFPFTEQDIIVLLTALTKV